MSTFTPKTADIQRAWLEVDATGLTLGRLATEVASRLRGKHKAIFTPHLDTGDHVIIVNADKVAFDTKKADATFYHRYSGYPGGLRSRSYTEMLATKPEELIRITVKGMLPKNSLGRQMINFLSSISLEDVVERRNLALSATIKQTKDRHVRPLA